MDREIRQLVEMGASEAQAQAALRRYKDVMQAAERIFEGEFADVEETDEDVSMESAAPVAPITPSRTPRSATPDEDGEGEDDNDVDMEEDEDEGE